MCSSDLYVERMSRRLARRTFYALVRLGEAFRDEQAIQNRIEAIGEDLLTILATAVHAERRTRLDGGEEAWELAHLVFAMAKARIHKAFRELGHPDHHMATHVGLHALNGGYPGLSEGIIRRGLNDYLRRK